MEIQIKKISGDDIQTKGINTWPIWTKEVSNFEWFYDSAEHCLLLEGRVVVKTDFESVEIQAGDYVIFPKGLKCTWNVLVPVKKHYFFE